jgi:hypothetical protein
MRVLEARFHPRQKAGPEEVVVAHVIWNGDDVGDPPTVRPTTSVLARSTRAAVLSKLQYLVAVTAPRSFEGLQALRSAFWSFVEVTHTDEIAQTDDKGGHGCLPNG